VAYAKLTKLDTAARSTAQTILSLLFANAEPCATKTATPLGCYDSSPTYAEDDATKVAGLQLHRVSAKKGEQVRTTIGFYGSHAMQGDERNAVLGITLHVKPTGGDTERYRFVLLNPGETYDPKLADSPSLATASAFINDPRTFFEMMTVPAPDGTFKNGTAVDLWASANPDARSIVVNNPDINRGETFTDDPALKAHLGAHGTEEEYAVQQLADILTLATNG